MTNREILNKWYESISNNEQIDLSIVNRMLTRLNNEQDPVLKKQKRARLINGLLYNVYKFIRSSVFMYIDDSLYDMNDLISDSIITLIEIIDQRKIRHKATVYTQLEFRTYQKLLNNNLYGIDSKPIMTIIGTNKFNKAFINYLPNQYEENILTEAKTKSLFNDEEKNIEITNALNNMHSILHLKYSLNKYKKSKLLELKKLLYIYGINYNARTDINFIKDDFDNKYEDQETYKKLLEIIYYECKLTNNERNVMRECYENNIPLKDIARILNFSQETPYQLHNKSLIKIRRYGLDKINKLLF